MQVKEGLNNLIFSIGFQMLKTWFFQMFLNTCEMCSNGIKIAFYFKNYKKIEAPRPLKPTEAQTLFCDTFELH